MTKVRPGIFASEKGTRKDVTVALFERAGHLKPRKFFVASPLCLLRFHNLSRTSIKQGHCDHKLLEHVVLRVRLAALQSPSTRWSLVPARGHHSIQALLRDISKGRCGTVGEDREETERVEQAIGEALLPVLALNTSPAPAQICKIQRIYFDILILV
jgi:hypothetical protein